MPQPRPGSEPALGARPPPEASLRRRARLLAGLDRAVAPTSEDERVALFTDYADVRPDVRPELDLGQHPVCLLLALADPAGRLVVAGRLRPLRLLCGELSGG